MEMDYRRIVKWCGEKGHDEHQVLTFDIAAQTPPTFCKREWAWCQLFVVVDCDCVCEHFVMQAARPKTTSPLFLFEAHIYTMVLRVIQKRNSRSSECGYVISMEGRMRSHPSGLSES